MKCHSQYHSSFQGFADNILTPRTKVPYAPTFHHTLTFSSASWTSISDL